jgi:peroxiredoxin Q/BCP
MEHLIRGAVAPDFAVIDLEGNTQRLSDYRGQKVLLTFLRYATCPFCTIRYQQLINELPKYEKQGLKVLVVFESSPDYIREYLSRRGLPFPVIPNPEGQLYRLYQVEHSMGGLMFGMLRLPSLIRAMFDPRFKMAKPDSSITRIPADFLIDEGGVIADSYYGRDIGDHIPFKRIDQFTVESIQMVPLPLANSKLGNRGAACSRDMRGTPQCQVAPRDTESADIRERTSIRKERGERCARSVPR